jgi:hypothetical protein
MSRRPATFARVVRRRKRRVRDAQRLEADRRASGLSTAEFGKVGQYLAARARMPAGVGDGGEPLSNIGELSFSSAKRAPSPLCLLAQRALAALGGRAIADGPVYRLDGAAATLADLVVAARAAGVVLSYPGIHPHATAFHPGPSAALPPRPRQDAATPRASKKPRENHHAEDQEFAGARPRR